MINQQSIESSIAGKVVLVTGGGSGIGRAVSELFGRAGAKVVSMDLNGNPDGTNSDSSGIVVLQGDVTREESCQEAVDIAVSSFGQCDILVNAAGIVEKTRRTVNQNVADWKKTMDVNLLGTYQMSMVTARKMVELRGGGSIINVASITGLGGFRASNSYGVSKAAVIMLTKTMAVDLAVDNIRVNVIAPGFINTPMTADLRTSSNVARETFIQRIPMARFGEVDEVARTILFLCSDWASYITGAVIPVDGGWSAFAGPSSS